MSILVLAAPLLVVGLLVIGLGVASRMEKLPINSLIGIRVPATQSSPTAWSVGHRAAALWIGVGGLGLTVAASVLLATSDETGFWAMLGTGWLVLFLVLATVVASRAARGIEASPGIS